MNANFNFRPFFKFSKWLVPKGFTGITILLWVIRRKNPDGTNPTLTERFKRHETIHAWQQVCLIFLGLVACAITSLIFGIWGAVTPWWVWLIPLVLPLALYVLVWLIEIILPPYNVAYRDSAFEREASMNDEDANYKLVPFAFVKYFRKKRTLWDKKK